MGSTSSTRPFQSGQRWLRQRSLITSCPQQGIRTRRHRQPSVWTNGPLKLLGGAEADLGAGTM